MRSSFLWFVLVLLALPASAETPAGWIADAKTGCRIWNDLPQPKETVSWTGGCQNDLAQGRGVLQWFSSGKLVATYEGEYQDGKMNGRGVFLISHGNRYEGELRDDQPSGRGVFTDTTGNRYEGEWRNGVANGTGTFKLVNGATYSGTWKNGCYRQGNRTAWVATTPKDCGFQ